MPSLIADGNARALDTPVTACVRINADDCTGTGGTDGDNGTDGNPDLPAIAADSTAVVGDQLDGVVCLRINGGDCGDGTDDGTGTGNGPATVNRWCPA